LLDTVFYTPGVVNAPGNIATDIRQARDTLKDLAKRPLRMDREKKLESIHRRDEQHAEKVLRTYDWLTERIPKLRPTYGQVARWRPRL
jgi:hypothetical protein